MASDKQIHDFLVSGQSEGKTVRTLKARGLTGSRHRILHQIGRGMAAHDVVTPVDQAAAQTKSRVAEAIGASTNVNPFVSPSRRKKATKRKTASSSSSQAKRKRTSRTSSSKKRKKTQTGGKREKKIHQKGKGSKLKKKKKKKKTHQKKKKTPRKKRRTKTSQGISDVFTRQL